MEKINNNYHWHAGFFERNNHPENKYFLLVNLNVNSNTTAKLKIDNNTEYHNLSFRDVEGELSEANKTLDYNSSVTSFINVPAGEGYLFQVAPVVKYGGNLIYDEAINESCSLKGKIIIKNNATLAINSDYYIDGDIVVEDGKIEYGENGKIHYINSDKTSNKDAEDKSE
jgi:hypothetical protein